jgi:cyanophycin synthetase
VDVVLPSGAAVLKADDPLVADMARLSDGAVIFFARDPEHPVMAAHRAEGKRSAYLRDGQLVLAEGATETSIGAMGDLSLTQGGKALHQAENALAAAAGAWALGVSIPVIRERLASFRGGLENLPGRLNVLEHRGATVVIDDCHNASALQALAETLDRFPAGTRSVVYSAGFGRRDADVVRQGELLGAAFDRVIVYEDISADDRPEGGLSALFREGLAKGGRVTDVIEIRDHSLAVETALGRVRPGEILVVQTEDAGVEPTVELVRGLVSPTGADAMAGTRPAA